MSCFVMRAARNVRFCHGPPHLPPAPFPSCRSAVSGPGRVLPSRTAARPILRSFHPSAFRMSFLHPVSFHFVPFSPPPACPASGTLFRAYRGRGRAGVGAGAVRAPDCACAREPKHRAHVSRPFLGGFFSRRREPEGETAPRMPTRLLPPYLAIDRRRSSSYRELFLEFRNTMPLSPRRGCSPA